jgi:ribosomal protein S30
MKKCSQCHVDKPTVEFHKNARRKDGLQTMCIPCKKQHGAVHYKKNIDKYKVRAVTHRKDLSDWYSELKKDLKCSKCGNNHPAVLDFHHRDRTTKESTVAQLKSSRSNKQAILDEIEKCDVLCANCHRILHWEERNMPS